MYADDLKFGKIIENVSDSKLLQEDLDRLGNWCKQNKMHLNHKKCQLIKFTRNLKIIDSSYLIDGHKIHEQDTVRDLGILYDRKLTFVPHIENIIKRGSKLLGFVIRNGKPFRNPKTKILLFYSLIRSILEYSSVVWRPHYSTHSLRIERLQKRFLRHLAFSVGMAKKLRSYDERLNHFGMLSLSERRDIIDMSFLFKLFRNGSDCPQILENFNLRVPSRIPRKPITPLYPPLSRTVLGSYSPVSRLCKTLNKYSDIVDIHHDSLATFRNTIYKHIVNNR